MARKIFLFVGTYTKQEPHVDGHAEGIYTCSFDGRTGEISRLSAARGIVNPSFLTVHPRLPLLYAVSEVDDFRQKPTGALAAYRIDPQGGGLTIVNMKESGGKGPCHVCVNPAGTVAAVANYLGGSIATFPLDRDGTLLDSSSVVKHEGRSVNPDRQEGPHPHSANIDGTNNFIVVPDLGLDKIVVYRIDRGSSSPELPPREIAVTPGSGPRHFTFHRNSRRAYLINELASTVEVFDYRPEDCSLRKIQQVSALPEGFQGLSASADIHIHPSGDFLYASNRGADSIAVFRIDRKTGFLHPAGHEPTRGETPRNFTVTEDGRFLLAANQDSDSISVYSVNAGTGELSFLGITEMESPVCLHLWSPGS